MTKDLGSKKESKQAKSNTPHCNIRNFAIGKRDLTAINKIKTDAKHFFE